MGQLRDLLREHAESLSKEAAQSNGKIAEEQGEALERLARVVEICDKTRPPKTRKRWPVAAILGTCLIVISILFFARLPKTEVELDLKLTNVRFDVSRQVMLIKEMRLSTLGISQLREIQLPRTRGRDAQTIQSPEGAKLRLSIPEKAEGTIEIRDLLLPVETRVWVSSTNIPHQYRVILEVPKGVTLDLQVNVRGTLQVIRAGTPPEEIEYSVPKAIHMQPASQQITLDLTLHDGAQEAFSSYLPSRDLLFARIEEYKDTDKTYVRRVSTVNSGSLYLADLNGKKYSLRSGEELQFKQSEGQIRMLKPEKNQLMLNFYGDVRGMTTGWEEKRISLMPTCLDWLRARHGLSLLWGMTLFLFGIVNRVMRWWKGGK